MPVLKVDAAAIDRAVAQVASQVDKPAVDSKLEKDSGRRGAAYSVQPGGGGGPGRAEQGGIGCGSAGAVRERHRDHRGCRAEGDGSRPAGREGAGPSPYQQPVVLTAGDQTMDYTARRVANFLSIERASDGTVRATLDNNELAAYFRSR